MKITVLTTDQSGPNSGLKNEHGLSILTDKKKKYPLPESNRKLFKKMDKSSISPDFRNPYSPGEEELMPDDFDHEIIPCFCSNDQVVVFTGCAHQGILNVMENVREHFPGKMTKAVMGGFHLPDKISDNQIENGQELDFVAEKLSKYYPVTNFYTGHCTGPVSFERLKRTLGERIHYFYPGYTIMTV